MKILILEDQSGPLEVLEVAISTLFLEFYPDEKFELDVARSFLGAKALINANQYDFAFIDHRIPYEDVGNLEEEDFERFIDSLEEIGYIMIKRVKEASPNVIVIGTSSLSSSELKPFIRPDYKIRKNRREAKRDLRRVLSEIK